MKVWQGMLTMFVSVVLLGVGGCYMANKNIPVPEQQEPEQHLQLEEENKEMEIITV